MTEQDIRHQPIDIRKNKRPKVQCLISNVNRGFTIVELLVVLAVVALILTGVVNIITVAVRNARVSKDQSRASRFTQEAMEWIRQQRDTDWITFSGKSGQSYCMSSLSWSSIGTCNSSNTIPGSSFLRNVSLQTIDANTVLVDVAVSWTDTTGTHQSRSSTYLTHWK